MYTKQLSDLTYSSCLFRFLTKLSDQVVALISDGHSAKLVFQDDANDPSLDLDVNTLDDSDRLFDFEVKETGQQDKTTGAAEGFKVRLFASCSSIKISQHLKDIPLLHVRNKHPPSNVPGKFRYGAPPTQGDCRRHETSYPEHRVYPREIKPSTNRGIAEPGVP